MTGFDTSSRITKTFHGSRGTKDFKCCSSSHTQTNVSGLQSNLNPLITRAHEAITYVLVYVCVCVREGLKKDKLGSTCLILSGDERQHWRSLRKKEWRNGGISEK